MGRPNDLQKLRYEAGQFVDGGTGMVRVARLTWALLFGGGGGVGGW